MATVTNPDGTVSEFKIGEEETVVAKPAKGVKLNKDGTPRKKMGPKKKFLNERKVISGYIDVADHAALLEAFGNPTNAIVQLVEMFKQSKTDTKLEQAQ